MVNVRRWYVYLASAIALQAVVWAAIFLLRNLIIPGMDVPKTELALQISVVIVGLPLYLVHWVWAERIAARDDDERFSLPRRLYLYSMMAAFLAPLISNAFGLVKSLLHLAFNVSPRDDLTNLTPSQQVIFNLIPVIILILLWLYHWWVKRADDRITPESDASAIIRQLYIYLFCGTGLVLASLATVNLLSWLMTTIAPSEISKAVFGRIFLSTEIARLVIGLCVWLVFWRLAQRYFYSPDERETESIVRKVYLYLVVFTAVITVVTTAALVLADIMGRLLNVPQTGDSGDIRLPLSIVISVGVVWAYHAYVLRGDVAVAAAVGQQALVKRIYLYLMAGVGLAAVLIGLGGDLSVLIRALVGRGFIVDLRQELSWFTAALIAGLPVWLANWRKAQIAVTQPDLAGLEERRSFVRSFYLYFYLFVATMTVLGGAVYALSQLVGLAIGARNARGLTMDIGQAIAFVLIAVAVWLYHGAILIQDRRILKQEEAKRLKPLRVVVVDAADGKLGSALVTRLRDKMPSITVQPLGLSPAASETMNDGVSEQSPSEILSNAEVIVGPWSMAVVGGAGGTVSESIANSVAASPARKLLIPVQEEGWEWTGVEGLKMETIIKEVNNAIKQMAVGEVVRPTRRLSPVAIAIIVLVSLCFLSVLVPALLSYIMPY